MKTTSTTVTLDPTRLVPRILWRNPTAAEIRFGHGCTHYYAPNGRMNETVMVPANRHWVKIDGVRWNVGRN